VMESRLVGYRVVRSGCRVVQLLNPFEPQTATLIVMVSVVLYCARMTPHIMSPPRERQWIRPILWQRTVSRTQRSTRPHAYGAVREPDLPLKRRASKDTQAAEATTGSRRSCPYGLSHCAVCIIARRGRRGFKGAGRW